MNQSSELYSLPDQIEPGLRSILAYWEGLKRGENDIPFADDVNLNALAEHAASAMLIDAFTHPTRFRFAIVGKTVVDRYGMEIDGRFLDEMIERDPIDQINSQCHVTVTRGAPTYVRIAAPGNKGPYARLLLPLWANGEIRMLLGGIAPAA